MKPLVIVIPYFGEWPFWFAAYLESCRYNPQVDWVFYTDCGVPENKPDNTEFIEISFADYKKLISQRLGIDFCPESPYKLCDLKPALGFVHSDKLEGYEFWAFGDIDIVYGDLLAYYHPLMQQYDCISTHVTRISGHLCVMKNNQEMLTAFKQVSNWQAALANPEHQCFDERHFTRLFIKRKNWPKWVRKILDGSNSLRSKSLFHEAFTTPNCRHNWHDETNDFPLSWYWKEGSLTNSRDGAREYPYLHFMYWKGDVWPKVEDKSKLFEVSQGDNLLIEEGGFKVLDDSHV
jgi:Family of unknown function (DUF6625)